MTVHQPVSQGPPQLSQLELARLNNRHAWRQTAIVSLVLLVTVVLSPFIVVLVGITLGQNGQRERAALEGTYTYEFQQRRRWQMYATLALAGGLWLLLAQGFTPITLYVGGLTVLGGGGALLWMALHPLAADGR